MIQPDVLKNITLFKEFTDEECREILSITQTKDFIEGDVVFSEGDESTELFFLISGEIAIQIKIAAQLAESTIYMVKPNDVFGEFAFIDSRPRSASARCMKNSTLAVITRDDFNALTEKIPEIGLKFYRSLNYLLSDRLRRMNTYLKETYLRSLGIDSTT
jgi:CRP-like cAMP-binding protein